MNELPLFANLTRILGTPAPTPASEPPQEPSATPIMDRESRAKKVLNYLNEQHKPVTVADISSPPKGPEPVCGDFADVGGLGMPVSQVRQALIMLIERHQIERLDPILTSCAPCAPLYVSLVSSTPKPKGKSPWKQAPCKKL